MSCTGDKQTNIDKAIDGVARAAAQGAHIVCLQEVFNTHYPCQSEDYARFDWAEEIPGPTSQRLSQAAAQHKVVVTCSVFERRTQGLYHNTALTYDVDGSLAGMYRKMHIPMIRCTTKSFTSRPATSASLSRRRAMQLWGLVSVGISGIPKRRDCFRSRVPRSCCIRRPSAGTRPRKQSRGLRSMRLGKQPCARMRLPMVCMWEPPIA